MIKNSHNRYGIISVVLHWLMAIGIIATFALGLWMVDLDYYSEWYKSAPDLHRSLGVIIFITMVFRLLWRLINVTPTPEAHLKKWELTMAKVVHYVLYALVVLIALTGYLISTADGRSIDVFGVFEVPATITDLSQQADRAGDLHFYLAIVMMVLVGLHAAAALKHHFIDKDRTLRRMFGKH